MLNRFIYERYNRTFLSAGSLVWRWVELNDVERQIIARLSLQPCAVHGNGHVAIVIQCPRRRPGDCPTAGSIDVVQLNGDGGVDGVVVGVPCNYANQPWSGALSP